MNLSIIVTSYSSFTTHESSCEIIERDWNMHGVRQYEMTANSKLEVAQEMQRQEASHQTLAIVMKRVIPHTCARHLEGSGIKPS